MNTPTADAMTKPANMPTSNVPAEPAMSRLSPTIGSLRPQKPSFARSERAGCENQEPAQFRRPEVDTFLLRAHAKRRRVREKSGPLEPCRPGMRGRSGSLRLAHRLKTIA